MLDLYSNHIGEKGAEYLAKALKVNTDLHMLDIDTNNIVETGVENMAGGLKIKIS